MAIALAAGCSAVPAKTVTISDPNTTDSFDTTGGIATPIADFGSDTLLRSVAIARARGHLSAARALFAAARVEEAREQVQQAIDEDLAVFEPRLRARSPYLAARARNELRNMVEITTATTSRETYVDAVDDLSSATLQQSEDALLPAKARDSAAWDAAVLITLLNEAAVTYEQSFAGDVAIVLPERYVAAYGFLEFARVRGLDVLEPQARDQVRDRLDDLAARAFTSPTPPADPTSMDDVNNTLAAAGDMIAEAANVDTTPRPPDSDAPDRLALVQRALQDVDEAVASGNTPRARVELRRLYLSNFIPASPSLATVDPDLYRQLDYQLGIGLPDELKRTPVRAREIHELVSKALADAALAEQELTDELRLLDGEAAGS